MQFSERKLNRLSSFTEEKAFMRLQKSKIKRLFLSMRPAYTNAEEAFVQKYIMSPSLVERGMYQDGYGNCLLKIDKPDGTPSRTLWSCHTDSVHRAGGFQTVHFNPVDDKFSTVDGSCLGGDDNSGTYVLLELIRRNVPGLYIFHRAEEVGGRGSSWIASNSEDMLKQYDRAIAFDRKDIHSIITHQASRRCCSEAFSNDLSEKLGMGHRSDPTGSFTDTANYDHIIPECTNMSVGYFSAHTARETQLLDYLVKLMEAFARIDVEGLVTERDIHAPKEYNMGGYYGYGGLVMPSKEARTAQGWSKQDEIKWKQDKKAKSTKSSTTKKQDDFISPAEELSKDDLKAILGGLDDDDFGPKTQKSNKYEPEDEFDDSEPNWEEFFEGLPE
jgi:hypothetical protein